MITNTQQWKKTGKLRTHEDLEKRPELIILREENYMMKEIERITSRHMLDNCAF